MALCTSAGRRSPGRGGRGRSGRGRCRRWHSPPRSNPRHRTSHSGSLSSQGDTDTVRPLGCTGPGSDSNSRGHSQAQTCRESRECHRYLQSIPRGSCRLPSRGDSLLSGRDRRSHSQGRTDLQDKALCSSNQSSLACTHSPPSLDHSCQSCYSWDRLAHSSARMFPAGRSPDSGSLCTRADTCRSPALGHRRSLSVHTHTGDCRPGPTSPHRWCHPSPPASRVCRHTALSQGHTQCCAQPHSRTGAGSAARNSRGCRSSHS